jgi:phenylalanyl-tRNA synthetase beta chain
MIVTYNWLKEFVDFPFSAEDLADRLTMAGLEVDAMERLGEGLDGVIVARLAAVEAHPEADRLTLCQVETGSEVVPVVCGATNHKAGDFVALAQVGCVLSGDFKIKKAKIRGRESMGMLCSEKELGLAQESEGILILPPDLPLGKPLFEALGRKDVRFELGLTPNRPDCLSVIGVAREIAAMAGSRLHLPPCPLQENGPETTSLTSVTVEEAGMCPRYAARLIQGVKIGPSPEWLVRRLEIAGMRSINNVVDVTNYVLMELGHPLHAFDYNLLRGRRIVVKHAQPGENFTTLDGQQRQLKDSDLVIADGEGPVALAGIMGGGNSEVKAETVDILLESAYFNPATIRRTAKRLGMHTESSHRFERGADIDMVPVALDRAAALILELAGGTVARGRIDVYPRQLKPHRITVTPQRTAEILGLQIDALEIARLLRGIGLEVEEATDRSDQALYVAVPLFRPDLEREIDLIEEVARLNGYQRIPVTMPVSRVVCHRPAPHRQQLQHLRDLLVGNGFAEVINYSFTSAMAWDKILLGAEDPRRSNVVIINPLTEEQAVMRTTLLPSLLETVARNLAYRSRNLRLFEARPVFAPLAGEELPSERQHLALVMGGRRHPEGWAQGNEQVDFFDLKGVAEAVLTTFGVDGVVWDSQHGEPYLHPGKSCTIRRGEAILGTIGEVHPSVLHNYEIDLPLFIMDLDLPAVFEAAASFRGFSPLSRYPDVARDSAVLLDEQISAEQLLAVLHAASGGDTEDIVLFDIYRGQGIPAGKKSMAFRVRYRSMERTLTDEEINALHARLVEALREKLGAEIR